MPAPHHTSRPLLTALTAAALLVAGATSSVASAHDAGSHLGLTSSPSAESAPQGSRAAPPASSPAPSPDPSEDDDAQGLPWPGIVVGGGLGLAAGTALMVLSKRRENRD